MPSDASTQSIGYNFIDSTGLQIFSRVGTKNGPTFNVGDVIDEINLPDSARNSIQQKSPSLKSTNTQT